MDSADPRIRGASFSRLSVYEACHLRAHYEFALKLPQLERPADDPGRVASERGTLVHEAAEAYIKGDGELHAELRRPKVREKLEEVRAAYQEGRAHVEEEWAYNADWGLTTWFAEDVWLRVKLDAGVVMAKGLYEVNDWKTGKRFGNEVKHAQQGLLYGISTIMRFPEVERVQISFTYTDHNVVVPRTFDREVLARIVPSWTDRINAMLNDTVHKPKPSKMNCRFCPYRPKKSGGTGECAHGVEV